MGAQRQRPSVLRFKLAHQLRPEQPSRPQLGDLHEVVHADAPEEAQPRGESVYAEPSFQPAAHIFHAVGEGVGEFQICCCPRLLDVIAGDGNGVELWHPSRCVGEDVGDDAHGRLGRVDIGVAHHELFENVVLDGAAELLRGHALLLARHDVEGHDRQHRPVHRHGDGHLIQRNAREERAHVDDGIDRHARHSHIACRSRMVGVVASVGGQVERHRQPPLPGGKIAPIESVGLLGGGKARILADSPRPSDIHRGIGASQKRRQAGVGAEKVEVGDVAAAVGWLDRNALGGLPDVVGLIVRQIAGRSLTKRAVVAFRDESDLGEIRNGHQTAPPRSVSRPNRSSISSSRATASQPA